MSDIIFQPLRFRKLTVKNRLFRSSISGRFANYDGSGTEACIHWEEKFARGGVGAIISSHVPIHVRGRILPNYPTIDKDERIPFWREVGERVHAYDCKYILQLSHAGRQQDIAGVENFGKERMSSTNRRESFHGFECKAITHKEIRDITRQFAQGARRAREAGLDGLELHACNGYLLTQFLSSAINDRRDEYGGSLENRARFLMEVVRAVRREVGSDFHLQVKISAVDYHNALMFWEPKGNTIEDSIQVCRWLEKAGVDAIHVSVGSMFPHPLNPAGDVPRDILSRSYRSMLGTGKHTFRNYIAFKVPILQKMVRWLWTKGTPADPADIEGLNLEASRAIKENVSIPVLCTGGFQTASKIRNAIRSGGCDGVTIARPLVANPDLPKIFAQGADRPERPCTFCNRCLLHVLENPLGCYDVSRFDGDYGRMMEDVMSVFETKKAKSHRLRKVS